VYFSPLPFSSSPFPCALSLSFFLSLSLCLSLSVCVLPAFFLPPSLLSFIFFFLSLYLSVCVCVCLCLSLFFFFFLSFFPCLSDCLLYVLLTFFCVLSKGEAKLKNEECLCGFFTRPAFHEPMGACKKSGMHKAYLSTCACFTGSPFDAFLL